jgi:hypothetical protein
MKLVVANRLVNHLDLNKVMDPNPYGYQRARSTKHNLLQVIN